MLPTNTRSMQWYLPIMFTSCGKRQYENIGTRPSSHPERNSDKIVTILMPITHLLDSFKTCHTMYIYLNSLRNLTIQPLFKYSFIKILSPCNTAKIVLRRRKKYGEFTNQSVKILMQFAIVHLKRSTNSSRRQVMDVARWLFC